MCNPDVSGQQSDDQNTRLVRKSTSSQRSESSTGSEEDEHDGGYGWVVVAASFLCSMVLDGIAYSFGVLLDPMQEDLDCSSASISLVGSILAGMILLTGPISASSCNRFGPRLTCAFGGVISGFAIFISSFSWGLPALIVSYGVFGGFGLGLMYVPSVVCVSHYFTKRLSLATGICVCGSGAGTFVFAPLTAKLVSLYGWRGCNRIISALCLICCLLGLLMVPRHRRRQPDAERRSFNFSILKNVKFLLALLANIPTVMATYACYTYLPVMAKDRGLPANQASYLISAVGITNTVGRILVGAVTDLPQVNPILIIAAGVSSAAIFPALFIDCSAYFEYLIFSAIFGLCMSSNPTATSALIVEVLGREDLNAAFGVMTFVRGIAALIGPPISGLILDITGTHDASFYFSSGLLLSAGLTFLLAYLLHKRGRSRNSSEYQQL